MKSVKIVSLSCLRAQSISGVFKRSLSVSLEGEKIHGKNSKYGVSIETYNDYLHVQDGQPHNLQRWKALLPLISQILLFSAKPRSPLYTITFAGQYNREGKDGNLYSEFIKEVNLFHKQNIWSKRKLHQNTLLST